MDAQELFFKDGTTSDVFFCGKCRTVFKGNYSAEKCCQPSACETCGKETEKYWTMCRTCRDEKKHKEESDRFAKADKLDAWGGPVFTEQLSGCNEGFFENVDELIEYWMGEEGLTLPKYAWCCDSSPICVPDADDLVAGWVEDMWEDAGESVSVKSIEALDEALKEFRAANGTIVSWEPNFTKCVLIKSPPPEVEKE